MKYRVFLMESERGWGKEYWHEDYDTYAEAKERIRAGWSLCMKFWNY